MSMILKVASGCSLLLISLPAWAGGVLCEPPYNSGIRNGPDLVLCEIQATAKRFLDQRNAESKTDWRPLGPDYRIWVPPCQVPMKAAWAIYESSKSVMVSCDRTIASAHERKWKVAVSVYGESVQPIYDIHKAADSFVRIGRKKSKPNSQAGYPRDETMLPKCAAPLAVRWSDTSRSSVDVACSHTVKTAWGTGNWRVKVPVD